MKEMKNNAAPAAVAVPDEREAFEKWMSNDGQWPSAIEREADGGYKLMQAASHWNAWQARAALAATPAAEPFGYFKAEPFGWTDCGPDDEGAVALYEKPQAQLATGGQGQSLADTVQTVFDALQNKIDARGPISKGNLQYYVNLLREAFDAEPQQADARDAERLDWLTFHLSGAALRAIGVEWGEHRDARRAIDAAIAAAKGEKQ